MQPSSLSPPSTIVAVPYIPMQAIHFLRLLSRLNFTTSSSYPAARRTRFIRRAAYVSMACSVRPRCAWSRALLRRRARQQPVIGIHRRGRSKIMKRDMGMYSDDLRKLVPGGREMDACSLLEETGHYIQSLRAQVKVMQVIADSFSQHTC